MEIGARGKSVTFGPDPFSSEIHKDNTPLWLCAECRYLSNQET